MEGDSGTWERRVDRKGFVAASGLALAALAAGRAGDAFAAAAGTESGTLSYYNWAAYVNPKTYTAFTKATGTKVRKDFYVSNEALLAKLRAGARGYDLAVPTGYMVKILAGAKLLEPIDWSKLPNVRKHMDPKFRVLPYDPKGQWSVPKDWGTTGFVYRTDLVKERPTSWKQFVELTKTKYSGKVTLLDGAPECIGSIARMLGYSYNTDSRSELNKARDVLLDLKPHVLAIDSVNYKATIESGKAVMGMAWNGDGAVVASKKPAKYVVPSEGGEFWVDAYVIPVGAKNAQAAHQWINFAYQPKINALETSYTYYGSPLKRPLLRTVLARSILNDPAVFPPANLLKRLEANDISPEGTRLRDRIWTEFKAA
jgi:spermidine/putrescine transport system substrate-binding protein